LPRFQNLVTEIKNIGGQKIKFIRAYFLGQSTSRIFSLYVDLST